MSHPVLTRRARVLILSMAVAATLSIPAALAESATPDVRSGWWWAAQFSPTFKLPVPYGTGPGELLVSRHAGLQEKSAAVWIDVSRLGEAPRSMQVSLDELESPAPTLLSGDLLACPIANTPWEPAQGGSWSARPRGGCVAPYSTVGSRDAAGRWTFDLTGMATGWQQGHFPNLGFEIVPAQHLRAPSFEIGLRAPDVDDIRVVLASAAPPAVVDDAAATAAPTPAPSTVTPGAHGDGPAAEVAWSTPLPSSGQADRASGEAAATPSPEAAVTAADPADPADEAAVALRAAANQIGDSSGPSLQLALAFLTLGASAALGWRRVKDLRAAD